MTDTNTKMLQLVLGKLFLLDKKMEEGFSGLNEQNDSTNKSIDRIGLQLANLDYDAPTAEEFEALEVRVGNLENQVSV